MRTPAISIRFALLALGLLLTAACSAHNDAAATDAAAGAATPSANAAATSAAPASTFTEGDEFISRTPPAGTPAPTGPVRIVEVFSYACPHCAEFAPYMDKVRAALPPGVEVRYMPAVFYPEWTAAAQTFYALRQMNALDKTHDLIFKAHREHYPLNSLDDYATFLAAHGVDKQKFQEATINATTMRELAADHQTEAEWGIDATPTLVVGRMSSDAKDATFVPLMRSANITSLDELQQLGLWMANKVAASH